jgi:GNAT superfamily N-acetyltransferase
MTVRINALVDPDVTPTGPRLVWLASDADRVPVGSAFLRLYARSGQQHLADLQLNIPAGHRDAGSRLLDCAVTAAHDHGRRRIITHVQADSPGEIVVVAGGFRKVLTLTTARLPLPEADTTTLAGIVEQPHPGYRLESWEGMVPDELAATFVASRHAMNDTPTGGIDFSSVPWDLERVSAAATAVEKSGDILHTVVAITTTDGTIAGFTELAVPGDGTGDAQHYGTAVLPEHRGHGLGLWMKAASIRLARERFPLLCRLLTDTADTNAHIARINDTLGYRPLHTTYEYQLDL